MNRTAFLAGLLAMSLPLSQLVYIADADAQRGYRERDRPQQSQAAQEVRYPDATREERRPQTSDRIYRQISKAFDDINEERFDRARDALTGLEANDRLSSYERAVVYQGLAQLAYEDDDVKHAISYWNRAIELDALPNNDHYQLMYQVAQLQLSEEQYEDSLRMLERWTNETRSSNPDAMALHGNLLYRMERYSEAIQVLDRAIAASDSPPVTLFELKMASYYEQDDYAGAARTLQELIQREPNEVKHQINLAQTYIQMDQNDEALAVLATARERKLLTEASHWRQLYQLLSYADQPEQAAQVIRDGIQDGFLEADATTLRALGDNFYLAEKLDEAIEAYQRASAASTDGNASQQLAHVLIERERHREARDALQAAFEKGGLRDPGVAYLLLGEAEMEAGNRTAAKAAFEKALEHENTRSNAQIWLRNF